MAVPWEGIESGELPFGGYKVWVIHNNYVYRPIGQHRTCS
jgi:hypothetical protein